MTDEINDGGPAFPNPALADPNFIPSHDMSGMTLRDLIAVQWFANAKINAERLHVERGQSWEDVAAAYWLDVAKNAYIAADAMLKAREGKS